MPITTTSTTNLAPLDLSGLRLTHAQFEQLCQHNPDTRLELTADGYLTTMAPTFGESSKRNFDLIGQIWLWNRKTQLGVAFESSGGFILPNGATRWHSLPEVIARCILGRKISPHRYRPQSIYPPRSRFCH